MYIFIGLAIIAASIPVGAFFYVKHDWENVKKELAKMQDKEKQSDAWLMEF